MSGLEFSLEEWLLLPKPNDGQIQRYWEEREGTRPIWLQQWCLETAKNHWEKLAQSV